MILFSLLFHCKVFFFLTFSSSVLGPYPLSTYTYCLDDLIQSQGLKYLYADDSHIHLIWTVISYEAQAYSSSLSQYAINISNLKWQNWTYNCSPVGWWQLHSSHCSAPKPWCHPWLLSFITHIQSISKSYQLTSKCKSTISEGCHYHHHLPPG